MKIEEEIDLDRFTEINKDTYNKLLINNKKIKQCRYLCIDCFIFDLYLLFENQTKNSFIDEMSEDNHLWNAYFIIDNKNNSKYYVTKNKDQFFNISGFETFEEWQTEESNHRKINEFMQEKHNICLNAKQIEALKNFIITHK